MAIRPITGMIRRMIIVDLAVSMGFGTAAAYGWWYGFHVPSVRRRDAYYVTLEEERARQLSA